MKNIAVILRGHLRTWDYNHKEVIDFYDSIAENVEYYIATWQYDNMASGRFMDPLLDHNKKIIKFLAMPFHPEYYTSWHGPSWLNYSIIPYKKQREHEIKYDAVFDTRPDIIYRRIQDKPILPPEDNTLYVTRYEPQRGPDGKKHIGIEDHFMMSTSDVHDRINLRHACRDEIGGQSQILKFATDTGIHTAIMDWAEDSIVRPNAFNRMPDPQTYFDHEYRKIAMDWVSIPLEQKLSILKERSIREEDYRTSSSLAKL
jgi:hypothetical protein